MAVNPILLDTSAFAAYKRGIPEALEVLQYAPEVGVCSIVLGELLAGFAVGNREAQNRLEFKEFLARDRIRYIPIDAGTAKHYASVYRSLREKGKPIPTNDMWIAATALQHNLVLFTYDKHFKVIDDLPTGINISDFTL